MRFRRRLNGEIGKRRKDLHREPVFTAHPLKPPLDFRKHIVGGNHERRDGRIPEQPFELPVTAENPVAMDRLSFHLRVVVEEAERTEIQSGRCKHRPQRGLCHVSRSVDHHGILPFIRFARQPVQQCKGEPGNDKKRQEEIEVENEDPSHAIRDPHAE